jgi:hypothetical protein
MGSRVLVILGWFALALLFVDAFILVNGDTAYPGTAALIPTIAGVLLIASGAEALGPGAVLRLMPIRFIGKISYSLYLWHWPMLILGGLYLNGSVQAVGANGNASAILDPGQAFALALFSIPVATVSWGLVEEPFRRGHIPLPRPSRTVVAGVAVMAVVAMLATSLNWGAQATLAALNGPDTSQVDATDSPAPSDIATDQPTATPSASPSQGTLPPGDTPTPVPGMTPALTFPPPPQPPTTFAVTSALRPTLGNAPTDYEKPWRDNCLGWTATLAPSTSSKCIYGNPKGTYTVALIGDSHASALFPAVNAVAVAHGWKLLVYMKIDCSFVDIRITEFNLKREYTECATWNNKVITRLNASPPNLAIVHMSRWIYNIDSQYGTYAAQGAAMAREMKKIPKATKVVMVTDIPDPWNMSIPECLSAHLTDYRKCNYGHAVGYGSGWGKREAAASKAAGVPLIDLKDSICPGQSAACPAVINGMITFRDQHHLTATFSKSLGPALDQKLVALMNTWAGTAAPPSA